MRTEPSSTGRQLQFRIAGHPTIHALAGDETEERLPRTIEYWHLRKSTGILAFNLGQQFLDIIGSTGTGVMPKPRQPESM